MEKIYKITKGQLATLWIFGVWVLFWAMDKDDMGSEWAGFIGIITVSILVFYTIGWRNYRKKV